MELSGVVGLRGLSVIRSAGFQNDLDISNWAVLWIVNDPANSAEDRGETCGSKQKQNAKQKRSASHNNLISSRIWIARRSEAGCGLVSEWEERAAQAAAGERRGGGERGFNERRKFMGSRRSIGDFRIEGAETVIGPGSTNRPGEIAA
jgi:hypothetical protein